jgi:hypothetical protein
MFSCHRPHRCRASFAPRGFPRYSQRSGRARRSATSKGLLAASLAALMLGVLAPGALANPPTHIPAGPIPDFTLTDSCKFPVLVHVDTNNEVNTTFSDGRTLVTGSLKVTLTDVTNSKSIHVNISGPGTFTPLPNGETLQRSVGRWLFFFSPNQLGPGTPGRLILTTGVVTALLDQNGNLTSFTHTNGTTTDLCAQLA